MGNEGAIEEKKEARGALAEYERHKHALAQLVRETREAAYQAKNETLEREVADVMHKLAEDRFYLTVVGQFSRGKSTLMNAILGKAYLPSGVVPVTSAITAVSYGSRERVVLRMAGSNLTSEIGIAELGDFVTERTNPGNRNRIEMAEVQVPVEILQRGFFFVDTPGLGSSVRENTATTLNFLPSADAIVFVTSSDSPLTAAELGYLRQCRSSVRRLFLVVNKIDLVSVAEREPVVEFVKRKAQEELDDTGVRVYPVSARDALAARIARNEGELAGSGILGLESDLVAYLISERNVDFLAQTCDRAAELLRGSAIDERDSLLKRLDAFRRTMEKDGQGEEGRERRPRAENVAQRVSVLRLSCTVCDQIVDQVLDFFRSYQYDLYVSEEVQHAHAEAGGFCPMHTWQYANLASPQGICSAYPQVLFRFSEDLLSLADGGGRSHGSEGVAGPPLPADNICPACTKAREAEHGAVADLALQLEYDGDKRRSAEKRVCLTHLEDLLLCLHSAQARKELLLREGEALRRVAENLQRYALKHEGRRSDLITEEEWQAPKQALTLLAGHRNVQPRFGRN
jgi:ribosome biogenesis GTPase A